MMSQARAAYLRQIGLWPTPGTPYQFRGFTLILWGRADGLIACHGSGAVRLRVHPALRSE
jgi:hypothetical protein